MKKVLALALATMLALSLVACGDDDDGNGCTSSEVICSDGSKVDPCEYPECVNYFDRLGNECCPGGKDVVNQSLESMICIPDRSGLNDACKAAHDQAFTQTCESMKSNPTCGA